jgi:hypothetical protein
VTPPRPALRLLAAAAALLALAACGRREGRPPFTDPPSLPTHGVTWIRPAAAPALAEGAPPPAAVPAPPPPAGPTIESLRGRVVLVEFGSLH